MLTPEEAMRAPAPGIYKPMLIERRGLQTFASPAWRMVLRTLARRPLRISLTVFGVAMSMAMVVTGSFMRDSVAVLMETQFRQVIGGEVMGALVEAMPTRVFFALDKLPHVTAVEEHRSVPARLLNAAQLARPTGPPRQHPEMSPILDMDFRANFALLSGLLLTDHLAAKLHLQVGDTVWVELQECRREVLALPVTGLVHENACLNAYLERHTLNALPRRALHDGQLCPGRGARLRAGAAAGLAGLAARPAWSSVSRPWLRTSRTQRWATC